jgi:hypothetical protein
MPSVTIHPPGPGVYEIPPYPLAANSADFAFAGRFITLVSTNKQPLIIGLREIDSMGTLSLGRGKIPV